MSDSVEYRTVVSCAKQVEAAFRLIDRDLVHFLHQEGFITEEVHDEVLSPRSMWTAHQKAGELVTGIRNKVELSAQSYHTLLEHLQQGGKLYEGIVKTLGMEYNRQQQGDVMLVCGALPQLSASAHYSSYLRAFYRNNALLCDDKLSIAPCGQFVNLSLAQYSTHCTIPGVPKNFATTTKQVDIDCLVGPYSRFVLLKGPPGIGKSTLCWELCRKWEILKSLQHYKIVLLLKLRERRVQNATKLSEIFFHRDEELCQKVVKEVLKCEGEDSLLIFDGFDEMRSSVVRDKSSLIMELISGVCLPKATRLLTSRPSATHHHKVLENYENVEVQGFTDKSKTEFAQTAFKSEPSLLAHFESFVLSNPMMNSLMYIPVNCAIIAQVYKDIRRSRKLMPKTMTQLYTTLVLVLIRRHMIEKGEWDEESGIPNRLESLPQELKPLLERVSLMAFKGIHKEETQLVFTKDDVGETFQHLGLLGETKEMYVCEGVQSFYSASSLEEPLFWCHFMA